MKEQKISIRFYNDHEVRAVWVEERARWYFSVLDVVGAIASYFRNLDRQISLQTQRMEKLKQIKAACLNNMFV